MSYTKTTRELEDLGYLIKPTSKVNYEVNLALQAIYPTFDSYINATYSAVKNNWVVIGVNRSSQTHQNTPNLHLNDLYEVSSDQGIPNPSPTYSTSIEANVIDLNVSNRTINSNFSFNSLKKDNYSNSVVTKLKSYTPRIKKNKRVVNKICPNCLSNLKVTINGVLECSNDKLQLWAKDFLIYDKLNLEQQGKFLLKYNDVSIFLELYSKWSVVESGGKRPKFTCIYDNRMFNPISRFTMTIPDPILTKRIERGLKRPLTEEELLGEKEIWISQGIYSDIYTKGSKRVKITLINLPHDVIG